MDLQVLNVGDGACAVFTAPRLQSHFVVDCGATSTGRGTESAKLVADALGARADRIDSVLITHFDADHWAGIAALPATLARKPSHITLYYPHLLPQEPRKLQVAHLLLQSAEVGGPVGLISDIVRKWEAEGVRVTPRPVWRGSRFSAAGADWTVHWPTPDLEGFTARTTARMKNLATKIDGMAARDEVFRDALIAVQRDWYRRSEEGDHVDGPAEYDEEDYFAEIASMSAVDVMTSLEQKLKPGEMDEMAAALKRYTNMLSIVHASELVANFGDCEKAGLSALLRARSDDPLTLSDSYSVILAPHHGTQIPGKSLIAKFPRATHFLVNQNGPKHSVKGHRQAVKDFRQSVTEPNGISLDLYEFGHVYIGDLH